MFFSKVILFALSLGAISVLATPHALHHHALHRAVAARVASTNATVSSKRLNSPKCNSPSSNAPSPSSNIPAPPPQIPSPPSSIKPSAFVATVQPHTTTSEHAPTSTSPPQQQPTPTTPANSGNSGVPGGPFRGDGTWFATGLGACGITNTDSDAIVAVAEGFFDQFTPASGNPNDNTLCGRKISINVNGVEGSATVTDRCAGCLGFSIDMTPTLFATFTPLGVGRMSGDVVWNFV